MNSRKQNRSHEMIEHLELPQDILLGVPMISLQANSELTIENHRGLIQYKSEEIKVRTKLFTICVIGKNLNILEYRKELLIIRGRIEGMQFLA